MANRPPSDRIKLSDFSEEEQPSRYQLLKVVTKVQALAEEHVQIAKEVKSLDESANRAINEVKEEVGKQKAVSLLNTEKLDALIRWKTTISDLLHGSEKGDFGYFQKSNILWKVIILWPVILGSTLFGAVLTAWLHHMFNK